MGDDINTGEHEVRAVYQELRDAAKRRDVAAFDRLIADGFTFIHSNGATDTKKTYIEKAAAGALSIQQGESDSQVHDERLSVYEGHTAVWISRGVMRIPNQKAELALRTVAVYAKTDGRWQWVFGQSSPLPARPNAAVIDLRRPGI